MQLGLYLAVFANVGMEPEMQLGLYLALLANAGMEPENCSSESIWLLLQMQEWSWKCGSGCI